MTDAVWEATLGMSSDSWVTGEAGTFHCSLQLPSGMQTFVGGSQKGIEGEEDTAETRLILTRH